MMTTNYKLHKNGDQISSIARLAFRKAVI